MVISLSRPVVSVDIDCISKSDRIINYLCEDVCVPQPHTKETLMPTLVLTGANVVDPRDGSIEWGVDVTTVDGVIASIERASPLSADARRVDSAGKFIVPGYNDMHAHALNERDPAGALELMVASGITGFRQMSGTAALLAARRNGELPVGTGMPRLLELPAEVLSPGNGATVEQAVATLRRQHEAEADFIKVAAVTPAVFTALQKAAREIGITISGHLPAASDPRIASRDGLRSIEHLGPGIAMLAACSSDEAAIRAILARAPELRMPPFRIPFMDRIMGFLMARIVVNPVQLSSSDAIALLQHAIDTFDESRARTLADEFATNATWQTPTLMRQLTTQQCDLPRFTADPDLEYVSRTTLKLWHSTRDKFVAKFSTAERATLRAQYELQQRLLRIFDEAGVGILAGTDATGGVWLVPGPSLHHEFDELARAGLSPLRVLQSTTISAAEFLGTTATHGTVEAGKVGDLVVLDANPVESAQALHAISAVVIDGEYRSSADLTAIRAGVAAARSIT
jgi:imidazolonepropionase-like amidohydrolase